jgi:ATP-dependent protease ClpP protease subunit
MTSAEAKSYGIIDSVISNREEAKSDDKSKKKS